MIMYKLLANDHMTNQPKSFVVRTTDGACIPFSPDNTDYQTYLAWLAEGNLPSPADIVEPSQASVTPLPADEQP